MIPSINIGSVTPINFCRRLSINTVCAWSMLGCQQRTRCVGSSSCPQHRHFPSVLWRRQTMFLPIACVLVANFVYQMRCSLILNSHCLKKTCHMHWWIWSWGILNTCTQCSFIIGCLIQCSKTCIVSPPKDSPQILHLQHGSPGNRNWGHSSSVSCALAASMSATEFPFAARDKSMKFLCLSWWPLMCCPLHFIGDCNRWYLIMERIS